MKKRMFGFLLFVCCANVEAKEVITQYPDAEEIRQSFDQGLYKVLEQTYQQYRPNNIRLPSGIQALRTFYSSLTPSRSQDCGCLLPPEDPIWQHDENLLKSWIAYKPNSPAPRIQYAAMLRSHGWAFRGEGYSSDVKSENWQPFHSHINAAQTYLYSVKSIAS